MEVIKRIVYSVEELEQLAAHGDPSQDESGEKMPCPGSWSGQTCFALRNKGQYRCDACLHVPYEGCYAGRTVSSRVSISLIVHSATSDICPRLARGIALVQAVPMNELAARA